MTTAAAAALLLASLSACAPAHNLRVERAEQTPASTASPVPNAGPADEPFSAQQVRRAILDDSSLRNQPDYGQAYELLRNCSDCLRLRKPLTIDGDKFQIAQLTANADGKGGADDGKPFAGAVVTAVDGSPRVKLFVTGRDLSLTPGRGGTLVAQETQHRPGDPQCCPSGWSVRVYRYHSGRFEAGQRISQGR